MKRIFLFILIICAFLSPMRCFAEVSVPDLSELVDGGVITGSEANGEDEISLWDRLWDGIHTGITLGIPLSLKLLGVSVGVLAVSALLSSLSSVGSSDGMKELYGAFASLALCIAVYPTCLQVFSMVTGYLKTLSDLLGGITAAVTTAYVMGGNVAVASTNAASMYLLGNVISIIASGALSPFLACCMGFTLAGALPGCVDLSPVGSFLRGTVNTLMAFVFSVFSFALVLQNSIAAASDNLAFRTAKFASGVFIPVIGAMIGDASRTVAASILTVKSTVGAAGVATVIALMLPPLVASFCCKTSLGIASALGGMLGIPGGSRFLSDLSGIMGMLFALCAGVSSVLIITLAMFIRMEVTL